MILALGVLSLSQSLLVIVIFFHISIICNKFLKFLIFLKKIAIVQNIFLYFVEEFVHICIQNQTLMGFLVKL